jgi:hypothetical protein
MRALIQDRRFPLLPAVTGKRGLRGALDKRSGKFFSATGGNQIFFLVG